MKNDNSLEKWDDIAKDWECIPMEAYDFLFIQTKERYEDVMSESESLTNKTIKILTLAIGAITAFVTYNFTKNPNEAFIVLMTLLFIVNFVLIGVLLFPKRITRRGSPPNEIFLEYLDNSELNEGEKSKLVFYHEIIRYQHRIAFMESNNRNRQYLYALALTLTLLGTVFTAGIILSTIYHP